MRDKLESFAAACHRVAEYGLLKCSSGNMSWRVDGGRMLVSTTRAWLADLTAEQIAVCRIADGAALNDRRPSVESGFHSGILRQRTDVNVVLHFQSPAATTLACRAPESVDYFVIPEMAYYIQRVAAVPFMLGGSAQLAEAVIAAMKDSNMVVLANHGAVTVGVDFDDVIQRAVFFELACDIIVRGGDGVRPLSRRAIKELVAAGRGNRGA